MTSVTSAAHWPPLPLQEWEETKQTLHRYAQIVGKVRLALMPYRNHWWQVPLYVSTRGLTTRPMPTREHTVEIEFDFLDHRLTLHRSDGRSAAFPLSDGLAVADFHGQLFAALDDLGVTAQIAPVPFDLPDRRSPTTPSTPPTTPGG